jgi:hypothetical protein
VATEKSKDERDGSKIETRAKRLHDMMEEATRLSAEIDQHLQRTGRDRGHGHSSQDGD